jgi:predicted NAD/FAD-binding protein
MKIAIIGSGISGLMSAYLLNQKYEIELFEIENRIGGHTNTYSYQGYNIDTGFIVFNNRTYPNFIRLMQNLGVEYQNTEMSFSVRNDNWGLEYNGNNLNSLFADRKNLIRPRFYRLILDILRFNKIAKLYQGDNTVTVQSFLQQYNFNQYFIHGYLLPMVSAIWSMGINHALEFPISFLTKFFDNHGLLDITNRPQWYTIKGGSNNYIAPLVKSFKDKIKLAHNIESIWRDSNKIKLKVCDNILEYDKIVFSCHADTILKLFKTISNQEYNILKQFEFSNNEVILHQDVSLLPKRKLAHASWNYLIQNNSNNEATLTYNMNILQQINSPNIFCVTLNSGDLIENLTSLEYYDKAWNLYHYDPKQFEHVSSDKIRIVHLNND